jgi:hypothetical protein
MRLAIIILASIAGGLVGAAVACFASFWAVYGICRAIAWIIGDNDFMNLIWIEIVIVPIIGIAGFGGGGFAAAGLAAGWFSGLEPGGLVMRNPSKESDPK